MCADSQGGRQDRNPGRGAHRAGESAAALRVALCAVLVSGCTGNPAPAAAQAPQKKTTQNEARRSLFPVRPVVSDPAPPARSLVITNGRFFSYALPQGWRVGEDGQHSLTLAAPDNKAFTVMVGNAGMPVDYPPGQFVRDKLSALQAENLQIGQPRKAAPIAGFAHAYQFDIAYSIRGVACRGTVKCHVAPAYDTAVMAMTAALSEASQWPGYASWLPLVSEQVSAISGAAFGRRGIMAQSLKNSAAYAEAARQYRDWSQKNWQQVADDRNASQDRKAFQVRENLGAVQTYQNPFGTSAPVQLPTTYRYYWGDKQGNYLGSDDPNANPNTGSSVEWKQMPPYQP